MVRSKDPISVLLADDHPATREGLRMAISREAGMIVVGEARTGKECVALHRQHDPDVTLLDLQMPDIDGMQAMSEILSVRPNAAIVVLTTFNGDGRVTKAFALGATSYLLKSSSIDQIVSAVRLAAEGERVLSDEIAKDMARADGLIQISTREIAVLQLVAKGLSNREIAQSIYVAEETIKSRMKRILEKLGAEDRAHAVRIAIERGFLDL